MKFVSVVSPFFLAFACSSQTPATTVEETDASSTEPTPTSIAADLGKFCNAGCDAKSATCLVRSHPSCSTGDCILDARGGLTKMDSYCTSACNGLACPTGYKCEAVADALTGTSLQRCFKDGTTQPTPDAGIDAKSTPKPTLAACTLTMSGCGSVCAGLGKDCSKGCGELAGATGRVYGSESRCNTHGEATETLKECKQSRATVADWLLCCCE